MNKNTILFACLTWAWAIPVFGQLQLSIRHIPGTESWGVYVQPVPGSMVPTTNCITGSGQITLVAPVGFTYSNFVNHGGTWVNNASVPNPVESPGRVYISFGFVNDSPPIHYEANEETLLFSFKKVGNCPDSLFLISADDPFSQVPNSVGTNPGNELTVVDFGTSPPGFYSYAQNYAFCAWNCNGGGDCEDNSTPQDTTTTGGGNGGGTPQDTTNTGGGGNPQDTTNTGGGGNPQDTTVVVNPGSTDPVADNTLESSEQNGAGDPGSTNETSTPTDTPLNDAQWFMLSPNPASDWLHVSFQKKGIGQDGRLKLLNSQGILVGDFAPSGDSLEIQLGHLPPGMYLLVLESNFKILHRERFVKQ